MAEIIFCSFTSSRCKGKLLLGNTKHGFRQCLPSILPSIKQKSFCWENNPARDKSVLERKAESVYDLAELINGEIPLLLKLCYQ